MKKLLVVITSVASGCAPATTTAVAEPGPSAAEAEPAVASDAARQAAVVDSVRRSYTPADVAFMVGMIHHHAQALVMSRKAPTHGASASLRVMARRIINAQRDEIDLMQRWLRERGKHVPEPETDADGDAPGKGHPMSHGDDGSMMPGMLTDEQMAALDAARGEEFDRLFLSYMIQHHQGAVTMVEELVSSPGGAREETVFKLASDIGADQSSEITRMQTMLRDLLFSEEPAP